MEKSDFNIGDEFWTETGPWRVTDVGTRVITAIKLDQTVKDNYNGPPYSIVEEVMDEYDMPACFTIEEASVEVKFNFYRLMWKSETLAYSSITMMEENPYYKKIISLGIDAVPLMIDELRTYSPVFWFGAIDAITGEHLNIPEKTRGKIFEIAKIYVDWWDAKQKEKQDES